VTEGQLRTVLDDHGYFVFAHFSSILPRCNLDFPSACPSVISTGFHNIRNSGLEDPDGQTYCEDEGPMLGPEVSAWAVLY
jgi:hypothetical protein